MVQPRSMTSAEPPRNRLEAPEPPSEVSDNQLSAFVQPLEVITRRARVKSKLRNVGLFS